MCGFVQRFFPGKDLFLRVVETFVPMGRGWSFSGVSGSVSLSSSFLENRKIITTSDVDVVFVVWKFKKQKSITIAILTSLIACQPAQELFLNLKTHFSYSRPRVI